jgi:hypothetical protein
MTAEASNQYLCSNANSHSELSRIITFSFGLLQKCFHLARGLLHGMLRAYGLLATLFIFDFHLESVD